MELAEAEVAIGMTLPDRHRAAMLDSGDAIHQACDFLVPDSKYELLRLVGVNAFLHAANHSDRWPPFLVAFASNGCGDYFAYDLRCEPPRIVYIDPDYTVSENLECPCRLHYDSFEAWYAARLASQAARLPTNTD